MKEYRGLEYYDETAKTLRAYGQAVISGVLDTMSEKIESGLNGTLVAMMEQQAYLRGEIAEKRPLYTWE